MRKRLVGRAEPLFIDTNGLRSAASIWSGAQVWAQMLRGQPRGLHVVVWQIERLALVQLLVAALWDGRSVRVEAASRARLPGAWCVDGRLVLHDGQAICRLGHGGWPDQAGQARLSILDMLALVPQQGDIAVHGQSASHGQLWLAHGAPLDPQRIAPPSSALSAPEPTSEVLAPFDLSALVTPHDLLNDALLPLLRCAEVWESAALPVA